jgi:hypothetical protein
MMTAEEPVLVLDGVCSPRVSVVAAREATLSPSAMPLVGKQARIYAFVLPSAKTAGESLALFRA